MIAPFEVRIKCLLYEIWQRGMDWEEYLPEDLQHKWMGWCDEDGMLNEIVIPRNCLPCFGKQMTEVQVFCDSLPRAYGAVAYLRYFDITGKFRVSFFISKSRMAPLKTLTLPRFELVAVVIGFRVGEYLEGVYNKVVGEFVFWTDSLMALHWVRGNTKRWKQFMEDRVAEVQEKSNLRDWFYCPPVDNPVDLLTRDVSVENLMSSQT
ncbi:hypothetical protein AVEN_127813-1 [Araneus ventricosus]|uniref:Uncharacterized protein n=1 Tax=Araneus ventricosus TaxID=182803 RepID=A0A4Y1ZZ20_ARAVE|nr:hypothetical protein AVEN_127813-1 [Araneus ventricosus]